MGILGDIKGIDLSFVKDDGFRKFIVVLAFMVFVGLFTLKGLMPVYEGLEIIGAAALAYTGYNIYNRRQTVNANKELVVKALLDKDKAENG